MLNSFAGAARVLIGAFAIAIISNIAWSQERRTVRIPDPRVGTGTPTPLSISRGTFLGVTPRGIMVRDVGLQRHVLVDTGTNIIVMAEGDASFITPKSPVSFTGIFDRTPGVLNTDAIEVFHVRTRKPSVSGNAILHNRSTETIDRHVVVDDSNRIVEEGARIRGKVQSVNPLVVSIARQRFIVRLGSASTITVACLVDDFSLCSEGDKVDVAFRRLHSHDSETADMITIRRAAPFTNMPQNPSPPARGRAAKK